MVLAGIRSRKPELAVSGVRKKDSSATCALTDGRNCNSVYILRRDCLNLTVSCYSKEEGASEIITSIDRCNVNFPVVTMVSHVHDLPIGIVGWMCRYLYSAA